ncbi:MAG: hypothetical protein U0Q15_01190 [Kineosporiaceae bacterium]
MSLDGTTGPGTSPMAFPPAPIMPMPGERERDGSKRSLQDAVDRGAHHEDRVDDVPDEPWTAADVIDATKVDDEAHEALARLRPEHG